jgi:hypothetical protein
MGRIQGSNDVSPIMSIQTWIYKGRYGAQPQTFLGNLKRDRKLSKNRDLMFYSKLHKQCGFPSIISSNMYAANPPKPDSGILPPKRIFNYRVYDLALVACMGSMENDESWEIGVQRWDFVYR